MPLRRRLLGCVQVLACMGAVATPLRAQCPTVPGQGSLVIDCAILKRPALEPLRIGGEVVVGNLAGVGGFYIGGALGHHLASRWPDQSETTQFFISNGFAYTGAAFATAGGVYLVGASGNQTGSFSATMLGTGVGAGVAWVLDRTFFHSDGSDHSASASRTQWAETLVNSLLPSIGATIGFNSSRRFK